MAAIWAAAISSAAALGGGALSSSAIGSASDTSAAGSAAALAETKRQFDIGQAVQKPYQVAGTSALNTLARMYGLDTYTPAYAGATGAGGTAAGDAAALQQIKQGAQAWESALPGNGQGIISLIDSGASLAQVNSALQALRATTTNPRNTAFLDPLIASGQSQATTPAGTYTPGTATTGTGAPDYSAFYASPDYNYRLSQSMGALTALQSKLGLLDSGATQKEALLRGGELASGEFNNFANRLSNLAGIGQTAANNQTTAGQNYAGAIGQIQQNAADSRASAYQAQANTWANTLAKIGGSVGTGIERNASNTNLFPAEFTPPDVTVTPGIFGPGGSYYQGGFV